MQRKARIPFGYEDWGRVRMPLPAYITLTDRTLGTKHVLTHNAAVDAVSVAALDTHTHTDRIEFEAYSEPRAFSDANYRLVLDNGSLSFEYDPLPTGIGSISQARILTRRLHQRASLHIDVDGSGSTTTTKEEF